MLETSAAGNVFYTVYDTWLWKENQQKVSIYGKNREVSIVMLSKWIMAVMSVA